MSTAILRLSENGELQKIHDRWLSQKSCGSQDSDHDSDQLHLESFWGLFLICGISCVLALLLYFCKMLRLFKKEFPEETISTNNRSSRSTRVQTFLTFVDGKEDPSKSKSKRKRRDMSSNNGSFQDNMVSNGSIGREMDSYRQKYVDESSFRTL